MNARPPGASVRRRRGLGSTAVEFALIMVIFLNFAVGSIELILVYSAWSSLQWACDNAARQTMVAATPTASGAQSAAAALANSIGYTSAAGTTFSASGPAACFSGSTTNCITISGAYTYKFKLSTMGLLSIQLNAKSLAPVI